MAVFLKSCGGGEVKWARVDEEDARKSMLMMKQVVLKETQCPLTPTDGVATTITGCVATTTDETVEVVEAKEEAGFTEMVEQCFLRWLMEWARDNASTVARRGATTPSTRSQPPRPASARPGTRPARTSSASPLASLLEPTPSRPTPRWNIRS